LVNAGAGDWLHSTLLRTSLFGFVFLGSASWFIAIISFHIRLYADLPSGKLGLFFQIALQLPAQVWGLTRIGFVFSNWIMLNAVISDFELRISCQRLAYWVCFLLPKTVQNHQKLHKSLPLLT
jgi:hypothetical protein